MKNNFSIFYSWQSDIPSNRNLIQDCIEKAIKEIVRKQHKHLNLEISIDRDTRAKTGSPEIADTIFKKIETCDIFICDVTIINNIESTSGRLTPNPNVLIELGYAAHALGWERIICVYDSKLIGIEGLPFDIRGRRIAIFNTNSEDFKAKLKLVLIDAIGSIIVNFDDLIAAQLKGSNKVHDLEIYNKINGVFDEAFLFESISIVVTDLFTTKYHLDKWDRMQDLYKLSINKFIDSELDELFNIFLNSLNDFDNMITVKFHSKDKDRNPDYQRYLSILTSGGKLTEEQNHDFMYLQQFQPNKEPFPNETWNESDRRIWKMQDELVEQSALVKECYKNFVMKIKQNLM